MWFDILKNVKQSSRQMINLDWDDETVPEEEESDCLKKLKEYYDKAKNHPHARADSYFSFFSIPEEVACAILEDLESAKKGKTKISYKTIKNINGMNYDYLVAYGVYQHPPRPKYQVFRVVCYNWGKMDYDDMKRMKFATQSQDLDADIDFRKT